MTELELLTVGRVSVDLYPQQSGVPLSEVESFAKSIGGSPTNVAVARAARERSEQERQTRRLAASARHLSAHVLSGADPTIAPVVAA